jgi:predicted RNase H-like HicB family nuclease
MKVTAIVHDVPEDEGGGYWAEVPALPGCVTQANTWDELMTSLHDVVEGWLLIDNQPLVDSEHDRIVEIAV